MNKARKDELRSEYRREDLGEGVRGKHLKAYRAGTNLVLLRPEVAAAFPTERAVNDALRALMKVARQSRGWHGARYNGRSDERQQWRDSRRYGTAQTAYPLALLPA